MRRLWPSGAPGTELDREALAVVYAHPQAADGRPFVRANFVASADGAVSAGGVSVGLHAPGDRAVFGVLRELADVVLAGAGTVRAEGYRGVRTSPELRARRRARGQAPVPPVAVVTASCALEPGAALFTDTAVAPLVLTTARAPAERVRAVRDAGADVVVTGEDSAEPGALLDALAARGLARVLCEGGPAVLGALGAAGELDELCLSVAPQLAGPGAGRIVAGTGTPGAPPEDLRLASVIGHEDGLLLRYRTARGDARSSTVRPASHPFE